MKNRLWIIFFIVVLGVFYYARFVEPVWLEVTYHQVKLPVKSKLLVAHISDLHTTGLNAVEKKVLKSLEQKRPDLILITGDVVAEDGTKEGYQEVLKKFSAPLGVWMVRGNWENWLPLEDERFFLKSVGIELLVDQHVIVREDLALLGFNDWPSGSPEVDGVLNAQSYIKAKARIALIHSPAFADRIQNQVSLTLAGHTHGGQVNLPLWGPLWLPEGSGSFVHGWYQTGPSKMYVSRGIGMSILPIRFFARPELAYFEILPEG